jgi:hypothetical protein
MTTSSVRVVLHGGLGNQLFQYFIGRLEAKRRCIDTVLLVAGLLTTYETSRVLELNPLVQAEPPPRAQSTAVDMLSRARLPKIAWRLAGREFVLTVPCYGVIIDGYFQWQGSYRAYSPANIAEVVGAWRRALAGPLQLMSPRRRHVTHVRLGDFFDSQETARQFTRARLKTLQGPTDLVTDQEDLVNEQLFSLQLPFDVRVVPTAEMSAWDLLALFCRYEHIATNGSSLAFWAAVLADAQLESSNPDHMDIWRLIRK